MKPERWQQVKELFQQATEMEGTERQAFLDRACGGDTTLRAEVESLLASEGQSADFMTRPPQQAAAAVLASDPDDALEGRALGPYRVVRRVGEGGAGAVYLAVRDDEEFKKRVAIKVVRQGMATREVLRRFRDERQILASINHPNIARLLDGGST